MSELAAFLSISVLVIVTPGPDTALTIRNTLLGGRRGGLFTAFGIVTGLATWALATSAGVSALLVEVEPAFVAIKLVGAAYLVFLGVQALRRAVSSRRPESAVVDGSTSQPMTARTAYRQGVLSYLGNPKIAIFFTSLLPQFAPGGNASFWYLLLLGLLFCAIGLGWLAGYAVVVAKAGDYLNRSGIRRALEGLTGIVLIVFGVRLATTHR